MNEETRSDASPTAPPASTRINGRIFMLTTIALIGTEAYFFYTANVRTAVHLQLGLLIIFLSFVPALRWIQRAKATLPVFEVILFTCANTYAFPLLKGHRELANYSSDDISTAASAVVLFQIVAIGVYELTRAHRSSHRFWTEEVISGDIGQWLSRALVLNTVYILLSTFTEIIPPEINSVLRAVFFGIGTIAAFLTSRRLGMGELTRGQTFFFFVNVVLQCIAMLSSLFLVGAVSLLLLALVGYISASRRIPVVVCIVAMIALAVLHNGKSKMREKYWGDERYRPRITELPAYFTEWFEVGLPSKDSEDQQAKITSKLIDRTSLLHILCLVVSCSPSQQEFLNGETYKDIPAQFVPRIFWSDKPLGHVSTSRLSVYYGLQTEEETLKTTIGFGMLAEAYANFGFAGIALIAAVMGFVLKKIQGYAEGAPIFSYGGLLWVILLAWSFQVEFTVSIWIGSFYQACVAVLGLPFAFRKIFG
jgi:hypothetical protein